MSNSYQLKSHPHKLLRDHLNGVSSSCKRIVGETTNVKRISTSIALSDLTRVAYVIGATHDIGKGTPYFQKYLLDNTASVDPFLKISQYDFKSILLMVNFKRVHDFRY